MLLSLFLVWLVSFSCVKSAVRLTINGSSLLDPTNNNENIILRGFNWYLPYVISNDTIFMKSLIPEINVVRLLGIFWDNFLDDRDCKTNNASQGYLKPSCLDTLDNAINIITKYNTINNANNKNVWVVLVCRAEYAAGQDYPTYPDVFHNATLRNEMYQMWKFVATHYSTWDYIAAYEIMAEPRTKIVNQSVVRNFYQGGVDIIHSVDPATPCIVGPAPFYKEWMLNYTFLMTNDLNVIYTVDFYIPIDYIESNGTSSNNYSYPAPYECNVALPGWSCQATHGVPPCFCPDDPHKIVMVNKTWLINLLTNYSLELRENYNVPFYINQWGIGHYVPEYEGKYIYTQDILDIMIEYKIHATQWVWKWKSSDNEWHKYELIHNFTSNNTIGIDYNTINIINNTWNKQYNIV